MDAREAFLQVVSDSGMTIRTITRKLNRSPGYFTHILKENGSTPRADTLAKVSDVCGYDLILRRRIDDYEILIEPTDE